MLLDGITSNLPIMCRTYFTLTVLVTVSYKTVMQHSSMVHVYAMEYPAYHLNFLGIPA